MVWFQAALHGDQADTEALLSELISAGGVGSASSLNKPTWRVKHFRPKTCNITVNPQQTENIT